ncbi:MAG: RNA polymerase sigma-70 factor [Jatrophihabitans sp.]
MDPELDHAAEQFLQCRSRLLGIAYRLLGSAWDAEDVVDEASVKWLQANRAEIREPVAYLTTIVTRLALDQLKSARVQREQYYGPWLPEPALTEQGQLGPAETAEQRESLSMATLLLMEQLTPPERAVFVLRTAFDIPYQDVAEILDVSVPAARQLLHRAQRRLSDEPGRFSTDAAEHAELFSRFLAATTTGDLAGLERLLAADVVAYNDGGGKARAAPRPVIGSANVLRFIAGLLRKYPVIESIELVEANGHPAVLLGEGESRQLVAVDVRGGLIHEIYAVLNPDKLSYSERQLSQTPPTDG